MAKKANGELKIERGVPIPAARGKSRIFGDMNIGDSVLVPQAIGAMSGSLNWFRLKHPEFRFTCRTVEGGTRVWRIK